jgi:hypothetical protein
LPEPLVETKLIYPPVSAALFVVSASIIWQVRITSAFPEAGTVTVTAGPPFWAYVPDVMVEAVATVLL